MRSIFLSPEQVFAKRGLTIFDSIGPAAPPSDLALLTADDDGFLVDNAGGINYYLGDGHCVDRFGRDEKCNVCAVRPAILMEAGDEALLRRIRSDGSLTTAEYGMYPGPVLELSLRDMAEKAYAQDRLK